MGSFILRRIFQTLVVTFILSFCCYYLLTLMPGDPIDILISSNPNFTIEDAERLKRLYGADKSVVERYANWLSSAVKGDFGYSRVYRIPVADLIGPRLMNTFILSMAALLLSLSIGIPIGVLVALRKGSKVDYSVNFLSFAGISIPSFFLGILLILCFSVYWKVFPAGGTETIDANLQGFAYVLDRLKYLVLPVLSLTAMQTAYYIRYTRSSMIDTMHMDFIKTARAKGLRNSIVIARHGLRNALIPVVTIVALSLSTLFSGAVITETLFSYQGVGKLVFDSISGNDFNVAMVSFIITIGMVLVMNLAADILYAYLDPRIEYK